MSDFLEDDDLVNWLGIDGTTIPLWLGTPGWPDERVVADDIQHGLLKPTRLRVDMPDMVAIGQEWVESVPSSATWCSLDETLAEMAEKHPPEALVQIDANYAYTEGVDAEALVTRERPAPSPPF